MLEVCVDSLKSLKTALAGGADRIELCSRLDLDGLSPEPNLLEKAMSLCRDKLVVMVRPRPGDFNYNQTEIQQMKAEVTALREMGCPAVVSGLLTPDHKLDEAGLRELVQAAGFMDLVFHRAFDLIEDKRAALVQLRELGVVRLLTSGGEGQALDHLEYLRDLMAETDLEILPGGGITSLNADCFLKAGARSLHASCSLGQGQAQLEEVRALSRLIRKIEVDDGY